MDRFRDKDIEDPSHLCAAITPNDVVRYDLGAIGSLALLYVAEIGG